MRFFTKPTKQLFGMLALMGYLGLGVFGFAHVMHMSQMNMPMENCPFAEGHHAICGMTSTEHLNVLQKSLRADLSFMGIILVVAIFTLIFAGKPFNLSIIRRLLYSKRTDIPILLYQRLFSQGILNPKIP